MDDEGNLLEVETEETKDLKKQVLEGISGLKVNEASKENKAKLEPGEDKHTDDQEGFGFRIPDDHLPPLVRVSHLNAYRHRLEEEINESVRRTDLAKAVSEYFHNDLIIKVKMTQRLLCLSKRVIRTIHYLPLDFVHDMFLGVDWFDIPGNNFNREEMGMELKDIFFFDMGILPDHELQNKILDTTAAIASLTTMMEIRFFPAIFKFLKKEVTLFVYLERFKLYSIVKLKCHFEEGQPKIERYCELLTRLCDWIQTQFGSCGNEYILAMQEERACTLNFKPCKSMNGIELPAQN